MAIPVSFTEHRADGGVRVTVNFEINTEAGQRLDKAGRPVKPHFIEEVTVRHNDRTVLTAYLGPAMARNPTLSFGLGQASVGELVAVVGRDNRGQRFEVVHRLS